MNCNNTEIYFSEKNRMTEQCLMPCESCLLSANNNGTAFPCQRFEIICMKKAIDIVQRWSDEHPVKTYKMDFLKKFPRALIDSKGSPKACRKHIYGQIIDCYGTNRDCKECWNEAME